MIYNKEENLVIYAYGRYDLRVPRLINRNSIFLIIRVSFVIENVVRRLKIVP